MPDWDLNNQGNILIERIPSVNDIGILRKAAFTRTPGSSNVSHTLKTVNY